MVNDWNLQRGGRLLEAVCLAIFGLKLPIFLPERRGWAIIRVWAIIRIITVSKGRKGWFIHWITLPTQHFFYS